MQPTIRKIVLIGCLLLCAVSCFAAGKQGSSKIAAAERLAKKGRTEEAVKIYKELLAEKQADNTVIFNLADLQAKLGKYNESASLYAELFRKKIRALRIRRYMDLDDQALQLYHRIDSMPHGNPRVCVDVADALMSMGKLDWARQELEKAISLDPGYSDAYFYLGKNYQMKREFPAAVKSLEKAVQLNPKNFYARNNLGGLYIQMDRLDQAVKQFTAALEVKKDSSLSYYNLGVIAVMKEDYPRAIDCLREALTYAPADMNAYALLADVYYDKLHDYRSALPVYEKLLIEKSDITGQEALLIQERIARCKEEMKTRR